jgi:hypothetical protein
MMPSFRIFYWLESYFVIQLKLILVRFYVWRVIPVLVWIGIAAPTAALVIAALVAAAVVAILVALVIAALATAAVVAILVVAVVIAALVAAAAIVATLLVLTRLRIAAPAALLATAAIVATILVLTRLGIAATAALLAATRVTAPSGNVQNLAGIDKVGILQPVDFSDVIRINPEHAADAEERITILDGVISATALSATTLSWWGRVNGRDS